MGFFFMKTNLENYLGVTSGPWRVLRHRTGESWSVRKHIYSIATVYPPTSYGFFANISSGQSRKDHQIEATARLFAGALDLLKALRKAEDALEQIQSFGVTIHTSGLMAAAIEEARGALWTATEKPITEDR